MPVSISALGETGTKTDLPLTHELKTQQLYTGSARQMQSALASKLSRSMLFHGPPALSLQDQKENKPLPEIPVQIKNFADKKMDDTRKKISDIGQDPKPQNETKPRSDAPSGAMNPVHTLKHSTGKKNLNLKKSPAKQVVPRRPTSLVKKEKMNNAPQNSTPVSMDQDNSAPTSIVHAQRLANQMVKGGNFSTFGSNNFRF